MENRGKGDIAEIDGDELLVAQRGVEAAVRAVLLLDGALALAEVGEGEEARDELRVEGAVAMLGEEDLEGRERGRKHVVVRIGRVLEHHVIGLQAVDEQGEEGREQAVEDVGAHERTDQFRFALQKQKMDVAVQIAVQ